MKTALLFMINALNVVNTSLKGFINTGVNVEEKGERIRKIDSRHSANLKGNSSRIKEAK